MAGTSLETCTTKKKGPIWVELPTVGVSKGWAQVAGAIIGELHKQQKGAVYNVATFIYSFWVFN